MASAGSLDEYARHQLTRPSATPKTVTLGGTSLAGLASDSSGKLWVDAYRANDVNEYAKSQLTSSDPLRPNRRATLSGNSLNMPFGLTFDPGRRLGVGNEGNGQVLEYDEQRAHEVGAPAPKLDI